MVLTVPWNRKNVCTGNMRTGVMISSRGRENSGCVKTQAKAFWMLALTAKPLAGFTAEELPSSPSCREKWREEEWGRSGDLNEAHVHLNTTL